MKRFTVPCDFAETKMPFHVYIGTPSTQLHPLFFQSSWLIEQRGGIIPVDVMDSFEKLRKISIDNDVSFEDLCVYALGGKSDDTGEQTKDLEKTISHLTNERIASSVSLLADENEMYRFTDEAFNLLLVVCKNRYHRLKHAIILVRQEHTDLFTKLIVGEELAFDDLWLYGSVQYAGDGIGLNDAGRDYVLDHFGIISNKNT